MYFKKIEELKLNIISIFFIIYLIIALIGFYLAKLFLRPIREERVKLNNFIKDTTHELNTPVTAILTNIEMIDKSLLDGKLAKKINRIEIATSMRWLFYFE